jgi:hypothetical protein
VPVGTGRKVIRWGTFVLLIGLVATGIGVAAQQPAPVAPGAVVQVEGNRRPPYVSTEGDDPAPAHLDGSAADPTGGIATDVPSMGLTYEGLRRTNKGKCRRAYEGHTKDGKRICSHGPDAAPNGIDVRRKPKIKQLEAQAADIGGGQESLPCYGDGVSGPRVQAIYAHASDVTDRSADVLPLIARWAANADRTFNESAEQTGGRRHVLWATSPTCSLLVDNVVLSPAGDDSLTNTINELKNKGYARSDRKYVVWTDSTRYCGIAEIRNDDQPGTGNVHNFGPMFARVDSACWGLSASTEAHELMHLMGGVQLSAPHSSGGWHCTDESDRMCLPDGDGVTMSLSCPGTNEMYFDCGHDDYFSTSPAPGSYLATHWNAADNAFLSSAVPDSCLTTSGPEQSAPKRRGRHHHRHRKSSAQSATATDICVPQ